MAKRFWPGQNPIGKRLRTGKDEALWEVVGVAQDSKYLVVFENHLPYAYFPLSQEFYSMLVLQVRTAGAPEGLRTRVQREIQTLDAEMPTADLQTMRQSLNG